MRLLSLTSIYLAGMSLVIFFLMGAALFVTLQNLSDKEIDEKLSQEKAQVEANPELFLVASMGNIPFYERLNTREALSIPDPPTLLFDSTYNDSLSGKTKQARYLRFYLNVQGDPIEFTLHENKLSYAELFKRISIATTLLSFLFILLLFVLNRFVFIRLWSSFFDTLKAVRGYLPEQDSLKLPDSGIEEFHSLNRTLEKMTGRISEMYRNLKDFTAHTTHEIQTPLAVIRSKTELLLQTPGLNREQLELIESIADNARHLSQLNRSLALLFKIGNHPGTASGVFDIAAAIREQLENLEDLVEKMNIRVTLQAPESFLIPIDPNMGMILVHNLVKNGLVHNLVNGSFFIELNPDGITLRNSGRAPAHPTEHYFTEFVKGPESKGLGLGLAMIRKIGQAARFPVEYTYGEGFHQFRVSWPEKK